RVAGGSLAVLAVAGRPAAAAAQTSASQLKISMIGSGREGGALGKLFAKAGHPVMFSSRHPENLKDLVASAGPHAQAGTVEQAVAFGEVIVIAVPYTAMEEIGKTYGSALAKKALVMDVSNPIPRRDGEDFVKSVNEQGEAGVVPAKWLPGAPIVRAFNAIGYARLAETAHRAGNPVGVPIAGDDPKALALAQTLIKEIGFEPVVVGGLAMGKHLVPGPPLGVDHAPAEIRTIAGGLKWRWLRLLHEAVEPARVLADDLAAHIRGQMAELALDVLGRVRPDAVGMREVRGPHDVVHAELVQELHAHLVGLEGRLALALPVLAGQHAEAQVLELVLPLEVHAVEDVGDPADAPLTPHQGDARVPLEHAAVDHAHEDHGHEHLERGDVHGESGAGHSEVHERLGLLCAGSAPQ